MQLTITEYHESDNGICDVCRRKAKAAVAITLPSMAYDYACGECILRLAGAVAKAQDKPKQPSVVKAS